MPVKLSNPFMGHDELKVEVIYLILHLIKARFVTLSVYQISTPKLSYSFIYNSRLGYPRASVMIPKCL